MNFKRNVGATSESIRNCEPKSLQQWRDYYFSKVKSEEHIKELGKKLYIKITEVIQAEVDEISEQDCIDYLFNLVITRTYEGYQTEIKTVYGQLEKELNCDITAAPDEWDRLYNVDFFIQVKKSYIGIQIKPISQGIQLPQIFKEKDIQKDTHKQFEKQYGGKVFYVFSAKDNGKKIITNVDVIQNIRDEINRLSST